MPLQPANPGADLPLFAACAEAAAASLQPRCPVPADQVPPIAWQVADHLAGADRRTITSRQIGEQLLPDHRDPGREIREILQHYYLPIAHHLYQRTGRLLIADGTGYHLTADPEDIRHYAATLRSRADCDLDRLRSLAIALESTPWQDHAPTARTIDRIKSHLTAAV